MKSKILILVLICVLLSSILIGCVDNNRLDRRKVIWKGELLSVRVSGSSSSITYNDSKYGVLTKVWTYSYPILKELEINKQYTFVSYVGIGGKQTDDPLSLTEIKNANNQTIWSE